ncbi:hypothetical protein B0I35DRAFT_354279 [Stachybotrys elegans]|uniref:non-specific serine/threonine protein kinase n=1 Tax=Stachybotrys elegans TaxID=80388 RepID=A0A8K0SSM0_9HYPO|nr:hypothetical protein B0I35DRAFT_354279 [Stachybotrys elegans]
MTEPMASQTRSPLAEATNRINSSIPVSDRSQDKSHNRVIVTAASDVLVDRSRPPAARKSNRASQATHRVTSAPIHPSDALSSHGPVPAVSKIVEDDRRLSQASNNSNSSGRSKQGYKTHIGPWQLGRTLGKGSSARVRLCRHVNTGQLAAVKIVNRRMASLVQDSSLAALSKWDSSLPDSPNGEMRVPMAIEREVAILKLIEHPNIMKLYDIWENRSEIYLILEYVDQGDLFTFINTKGKLSEEVTLYFFRQIISAMTYCHAFKICHRDLKPENILITSDLQIKIADFGMAALHQTDTHQLATACGSPHYAAPELLKNYQYRGDKADIWSMGVILYAMLSATLPFDDPDIRVMMSKTKKGHYEMPRCISPEAEDLIRRMLQVNPDRRISLKEIWKHPLVQRYNYFDHFGDQSWELPDTRKGFQHTPVMKSEIDPQLLRQLRSMWHMFSEGDLALKLSCDEPNDQKAFYWLLHSYREKQLEDFKPELSHSMSDYHHLKPGVWRKRFSTCEFAQPHANGQGRSISRFTVISTTAETEAETVKSYDPYRSSNMLQSSNSRITPTKITIHRDGQSGIKPSVSQSTRQGNTSQHARPPTRRGSALPPQSSRGSMASTQGNHQGVYRGREPTRGRLRIRSGRTRGKSSSVKQLHQATQRNSVKPIRRYNSLNRVHKTRSQHSSKRQPLTYIPLLAEGEQVKIEGKKASALLNDELRKFSSTIAKDLDEAFKSSLVEDVSFASSLTECGKHWRASRISLISQPETEKSPDLPSDPNKAWDKRPLPPIPTDDSRSFSTATAEPADNASARSKRLSVPSIVHNGRRIFSTPTSSQVMKRAVATLPSIGEHRASTDKTRVVSAPPRTPVKPSDGVDRGLDYLSKAEHTIRVVHSPSSPVKAPEPLKIRKKVSNAHVSSGVDVSLPMEKEIEEARIYSVSKASLDNIKKRKKSSWFKRSSKRESEKRPSSTEIADERMSTASSDQKLNTSFRAGDGGSKRKPFNFPFWKSNRSRDSALMVEDTDEYIALQKSDKPSSVSRVINFAAEKDKEHYANRNIEVKQSWIAKLFRVKPATSHLCMEISRKRARQEIALLLRGWRKYGIRQVQVDKGRNIVFARVAAENHLRMKEVEFAAEIMTVIEHGTRNQLSIVRFTQERGAASSFYKVADTMKMVFRARGLLVTDRRKQKMMIKTLNSTSGEI